MAKGTSTGLLDEQRSQSTFKHKLLEAYMRPFAAMTGSAADNRRVVIVDGFAGRGRYNDGSPGSAELILRTAAQASRTTIESIFVEKKRADFQRLSKVVAEYRNRGISAEALPGDVLSHLPLVMQRAAGVPLFLFLDPCGANLPFNDLVMAIRRSRQAKWPATATSAPDLPLFKPPTRLGFAHPAMDGDTLVHTDLNPANLIVTAQGLRIVDWAYATEAAPWVELALLAQWLIGSGHTPEQAETWLSQQPVWGTVDGEVLDDFAFSNAAKWSLKAEENAASRVQDLAAWTARWSAHRRAKGGER